MRIQDTDQTGTQTNLEILIMNGSWSQASFAMTRHHQMTGDHPNSHTCLNILETFNQPQDVIEYSSSSKHSSLINSSIDFQQP